MDLQDELDREQTHLYGLNDTTLNLDDFMRQQLDSSQVPPPRSSQIAVQLNENCLQCSKFDHNLDPNHVKMLQTAFKMACVKYKSSNVLFRGQNFTR